MYLSFDPGHTTGWAKFSPNGEQTGIGEVTGLDGLAQFMRQLDPAEVRVIIIEEYRVRGPANIHQGSKVETIQAIGIIKGWAYGNQAKIVEQPAHIKPIAYRFANMQPAKRKALSHRLDAEAHGIYYLVTNKIIQPRR